MTEAWLLIDEAAIRAAVGRPRGADALDLPRISRLESLPNPKHSLDEALLAAAGSPTGRSRRRLEEDMGWLRRHVAEHIVDFSPLLDVPAFVDWEARLRAMLALIRRDGRP